MFNSSADAGRQPAERSEFDELEAMPAELELVHQHLLDMRAAWQKSLPAADRLTTYAHTLPAQHVVSDSTQITNLSQAATLARLSGTALQGESRMKSRNRDTMTTIDATDATEGKKAGGLRFATQFRTVMATVAAILVVGLLAGTFAVFSRHSSPSVSGGKTTPTAQSTSTSTPLPTGRWSVVNRLTVTGDTIFPAPAIAPSNPNIVYEVATNPNLTLRRTADDGNTWQTLALPISNPNKAMGLYVSPLNPNVVILQASSGCNPMQSTSASPQQQGSKINALSALSALSPISGYGICSQYLSTNGGSSWTQMSNVFNVNDGFNLGISATNNLFLVQGNRLYAYSLIANQTTLFFSLDEGIHWQKAPTPPAFCSVGMASNGSTLFATTSSNCTEASDNTFWRSDDAGLHWAVVSHLSYQSASFGNPAVVANSNPAAPTVFLYGASIQSSGYALTGTTSGTATTLFLMSSDGGKTWANAPTKGLPAGTGGSDSGVVAQTSNGSAIVPFSNSGDALYLWSQDSTRWRFVANAPSDQGTVVYYVVTTSSSGGSTLWAVGTSTGDNSSATYTVYRLQL